jgi:uncharacterized protein YbjQ (UPF0145 family)
VTDQLAIPPHATSRISQSKHGLFTSDLSVSEFALVRDAGFDPVGLVLGCSIFHLGFQPPRIGNAELVTLSQAMYSSRELAMARMQEEADELGADGVIGVRLEVGRQDWGADRVEFMAIGTAVRHREGRLHRAPNGRPFTSDLSGQDFWMLLHTGHRPVGLVMGSCVYHVGRRGITTTASQIGRNVEMTNITQALYDARELAMARMQDDAEQCQATGIVGVQIQENRHRWSSHTIEFLAIGTAVMPSQEAPPVRPPMPVISFDS